MYQEEYKLKGRVLKQIIDECHAIEVFVPLKNAHPGGLIRPPLYAEGEQARPVRPVVESRYLQGELRKVVLLDSIESQANRLEDLLYRNALLPDILVEFTDGFRVSQYEAPHRIFDSIFKESTWNGTPFHQSHIIKSIEKSRKDAEKTLFQYSPLVLLLGGWHSHGNISSEKAPRWPRLVTLEIIGVEPLIAHRTHSRNDPLGISKDALTEERRQKMKEQGKEGTAAEAGLGQLAPEARPLDVVVKEAHLLGALSLVGLRNLALDIRAKEVLLLLALLGLALQHERGYRLRSGADLVPMGNLTVSVWPCELKLELISKELISLLQKALHDLPDDLSWPKEPLILKANEDLEKAYKESLMSKQKKAAKGKASKKVKEKGQEEETAQTNREE
ncbi:type I-U CRISPR-associated RAMP protein Csb1/Cas7u [Thermus tengchongensis]|uniref:type I-G CRISPR-associated RAMP protein Csb1/Cas7g n=1 Tax=Thermus tengchongensis TaxID=1214928 RepID=UPI00068EEF80|nr:type I-U CRISPR-associated RAMP protein Csb1/Cas7u [Thermus tengchongensis]